MEEKKKSKKGIIITILILVIIVLAGVGGLFGYKIWKDSQITGTDWGDTYLDNLKNKISNEEYANTENSNLGFVQFEENEKPAMVLNYETENSKVMEISVLNSENNVKSKTFETEKENELSMEMLYDIETKEYNWYEHEKKQDGTEVFTEISQDDIEEGTDILEDKIHQFTKEEMTEQEVEEGEIPSIPKFDEEFIKPEIELEKTDIDLENKDIDEKELKEKVENAVENYKPQDENISDEVKQNVDNSLQTLETKKEEIKTAEEEKAKKEAEEKAKAEEEARKKAEEEAKRKAEEESKQGLKVGNYTLQYGKYKGQEAQYDLTGVVNWDVTIELKQDGTYTITSSNQQMQGNSSGTYTVGKLAGSDAILLDTGGGYGVLANNQLSVLAGSGATFTYQGQ